MAALPSSSAAGPVLPHPPAAGALPESIRGARVRRGQSRSGPRRDPSGTIGATINPSSVGFRNCAREASLLKASFPNTSVHVVPNGVDLENFRDAHNARELDDCIVFTGSMEYYPNTDAVLRFAHECWPLISFKGTSCDVGDRGEKSAFLGLKAREHSGHYGDFRCEALSCGCDRSQCSVADREWYRA